MAIAAHSVKTRDSLQQHMSQVMDPNIIYCWSYDKMCTHYIFSYSDRFLILPYKFPNQGKGARRCCLGTILKPHLIWLFDYNFLMSFVVFSSDMKCKIFDFLQSILHNFYRCVDFMSAELTTMTLYLEFPRLLNLLNIGQISMILFMYARYSCPFIMSMCLQHLNCHCCCTKAV